MDSHVLITGTGRAGTSLLMQILTELGCDTGFKKGTKLDPRSNAGMEVHTKNINQWSYIVKNPEFCLEIPIILKQKEIDHVFICVRDPWEVVLSREINSKQGTIGGYWYAHNRQEQIENNDTVVHSLIHDLASYDLDHTLIYFDDMVNSMDYLWRKLKKGLMLSSEDYPEFEKIYYDLVDKDKIKIK